MDRFILCAENHSTTTLGLGAYFKAGWLLPLSSKPLFDENMNNLLQRLTTFYTQNIAKLFKYKVGSMNDVMIGRCFGHIDSELDLKEVEKILIKNKTQNHNYPIDKSDIKSFSVNSLESGKLTALSERKYIACLIKGQLTANKNMSVVNPFKNEIEWKKQENIVPVSLPFWIFKDEIIFAGAQVARDFTIPFIKDVLKIEVDIPHYDIKRIYADFKAQAGKVFGFGFIDRPNAISAGTIFGEMELDDPLVEELDDSDKNFVSINLSIRNKIIRASVYSIGSIVIMQKWVSMAESYSKLKIVKDALAGYEIRA